MVSEGKNLKLIKIMADSSNKRVLSALFFFAFALLLTIYMLARFAVPNTFMELQGAEKCPLDFSTFSGFCRSFKLSNGRVWKSYISGLDKKNIFFVVSGIPERKESHMSNEKNIEIDFKAIIYPVDENGRAIEDHLNFKHTREHVIKSYCGSDSRYCDEVGFVFYPKTEHENYKIEIQIKPEKGSQNILKGFKFFAKTQNPNYTVYLLALRITCLCLSLGFGAFYFSFYNSITPKYVTFEHSFIAILSIALILFNDPIYYVTVMYSNKFWASISSIFVVGFISLILFFWIVMVQRVHKENIRTTTKLVNKRNLFLFLALFIVLSILTIIESLIARFDPSFHVNYEYPLIYDIIMIIVLCLVFALCVILCKHSFLVYRNWNKIIPRHRFFITVSFYFVIVMFFMLITGLYHSYDFNGIRVLMLFLLFNFYVIVLQLFWRFENKAEKEFVDIDKYKSHISTDSESNEKKRLGMDYFDKRYQVSIKRSNEFRSENSHYESSEESESLKSNSDYENFPAFKEEKKEEEESFGEVKNEYQRFGVESEFKTEPKTKDEQAK